VVLKRCCACTTLILSYDDADADDDDDDDDLPGRSSNEADVAHCRISGSKCRCSRKADGDWQQQRRPASML